MPPAPPMFPLLELELELELELDTGLPPDPSPPAEDAPLPLDVGGAVSPHPMAMAPTNVVIPSVTARTLSLVFMGELRFSLPLFRMNGCVAPQGGQTPEILFGLGGKTTNPTGQSFGRAKLAEKRLVVPCSVCLHSNDYWVARGRISRAISAAVSPELPA